MKWYKIKNRSQKKVMFHLVSIQKVALLGSPALIYA
jgi:hypothetical protein